MNLGEMCYFDKNLFEELKNKEISINAISKCNTLNLFTFKSFVENIYHKTFHITLSSKLPNMEM